MIRVTLSVGVTRYVVRLVMYYVISVNASLLSERNLCLHTVTAFMVVFCGIKMLLKLSRYVPLGVRACRRLGTCQLTHIVHCSWCLRSRANIAAVIFNAEKSVGGHLKKSIISLFFNRIIFHLYSFKLKFQMVAERTAEKL